jgi:Mlc titration factor MtfA (ptsG expression regulator)
LFWNRKSKKRMELREKPAPHGWAEAAFPHAPLLRRLPAADLEELYGHIQVFLSEKQFEGCAGFQMTDTVRLTIAAQACLLLLHRDTDYFPATETIMVYPDEFQVEVAEADDEWLVTEYTEDRSGESWDYGPIVLSWRDVLESARPDADGYNVVIHEFSHQLDLENGEVDGVPKLPDAAAYAKWKEIFTPAYDAHCKAVDRGRRTELDEYGADSPHEFFSVVVEAFFEMPETLHRLYPDVYNLLADYFCQDPRTWKHQEV